MSEIRRILLANKTIVCFLLCVFLATMFFAFECGIDKYITASGEELESYVEYYPDFLQAVDSNSGVLAGMASMQGDFPRNNIEKTARDYAKLNGTVPVIGENRGIVLYSGYFTADLLMIALVLILIAGFSEDNKKGLGTLIRSTKYGRQHLSAQRCCSVVIVSLAYSAAVCVGCVLVASLYFGGAELFRPLQSIPEFMRCAMPVSIAGYLLCSCFVKAFAGSVIGLMFYFLSACFDSIIAAVISAVTVVGEYLLYMLIRPTDKLASLKFCNIISLLRCEEYFRNYLNINFFGRAVGFFGFTLVIAAVLFVGLFALCTALASSRTGSISFGEKYIEKLRVWASQKAPAGNMLLWEARKVFVSQKGLLILVAVIYIAVFSATQYMYVYSPDKLMEKYYDKYGETITLDLTERITAERIDYEQKADRLMEQYNEAVALDDIERQSELFPKLLEAIDNAEALTKIEEQALTGLEYSQQSGIEIKLIKPDAYNLLFVRDRATTEKNAMYILLAIIGMFAGVIARERQTNMMDLQRSSRNGRTKLTVLKALVLAFSCVLASVSVNLIQTIQIGISAGYNDIHEPAQSVEILRNVPFALSLLQYIVLIYVLRVLAAFAVGAVVMLISRRSKNTMVSLSLCAAMLIIPAVLDSLGLEFIVSFIDLLSVSVL